MCLKCGWIIIDIQDNVDYYVNMESTSDIGKKIKMLRKSQGESLVQLSKAIDMDRSYLNKVELGTIKPSSKLLERIIVHYSVEGNEANRLRQIAGYIPVKVVLNDGRKENSQLMVEQPVAQMTQVNVNPLQTPVLYTDSTFVTASEFGLVLDVAQTINGQQQNIVTRIGMSFDHAKKLIQVMQDTIDKNERWQAALWYKSMVAHINRHWKWETGPTALFLSYDHYWWPMTRLPNDRLNSQTAYAVRRMLQCAVRSLAL